MENFSVTIQQEIPVPVNIIEMSIELFNFIILCQRRVKLSFHNTETNPEIPKATSRARRMNYK
jgi:hypothetical protein